jgi:hypothetical protein
MGVLWADWCNVAYCAWAGGVNYMSGLWADGHNVYCACAGGVN